MIEDELTALADRVAPGSLPDLPDLPARVLARIDDLESGGGRRRRPVRALVAAALTALVAASFLSPQVRAFAADLLGVAGIEISSDTPDAPPEPLAPLPDAEAPTSLAEAQAQVGFPILVPARLGPPDEVVVADRGRVVTMSWRDGRIVLGQFDGSLGPVFGKDIGPTSVEPVRLDGARAWWIGAAHDLTYVDREGRAVTATARLAGPSLVWEARSGVTLRLEGVRLGQRDAVAIARSVR